MEAASISETSVNFYHCATTQKTAIFKITHSSLLHLHTKWTYNPDINKVKFYGTYIWKYLVLMMYLLCMSNLVLTFVIRDFFNGKQKTLYICLWTVCKQRRNSDEICLQTADTVRVYLPFGLSPGACQVITLHSVVDRPTCWTRDWLQVNKLNCFWSRELNCGLVQLTELTLPLYRVLSLFLQERNLWAYWCFSHSLMKTHCRSGCSSFFRVIYCYLTTEFQLQRLALNEMWRWLWMTNE
jgi:hypothetical protein